MITSVRLQSFKAHRDTTVPLGRLTVLVGPNGAGKTSVLEALEALAVMVRAAPRSALLATEERASRFHRAVGGPIVLSAAGESEGEPWQLSLELGTDDKATAWIGAQAETEPGQMRPLFGETVLHRFDSQEIAAGAAPQARLSPVSVTGGNTAAVLASLKLADDDRFDRIAAALKAVVPGVERIRVRRVVRRVGSEGFDGDDVVHEQIALDLRGAPGLPAEVLSEGTLVTVALLTSVCAAPGRRLVLLDDMDQSLHPVAQLELVRQIKRLLDEMPELQIIATTHSPFILDELSPGDVRVFALRADGSAAVRGLAEHPDSSKMKGALSAGQIWTLDPEEKWVLSERT